MDKASQAIVAQDSPVFRALSLPIKNPLSSNHSPQALDLAFLDGRTQFRVGRPALTDLLNFIHFKDGNVSLIFRSPDPQKEFVLHAQPQPCHGDILKCRLPEDSVPKFDPYRYQFDKLVIQDGTSTILVPAVPVSVDKNFIVLRLPKSSYALQRRKSRRYTAQNVSVELIQYGFIASGKLRDFSSDAFRIEVKPKIGKGSFHFDGESPVFAILHCDNQIFFTGVCRCQRQEDTTEGMQLVLISEEDKISRFKRRRIRNPRVRLELAIRISFEHPFIRKKIQLEVADISTSGFSVLEPSEESVLMPGMIIPNLTVNYAGAVKLECSAQVIYRLETEEGLIRSGVSILDMGLEDYSRLAHILTNAMDPHLHVSGDIDQASLWEFFFSSGFIYPKKYSVLHSEKEGCKETCRRLYQEKNEIARHFTYEKNGRLFGHISMVRVFDQTWVIHHHASQTVNGRRNGFGVLKALMLFLNDMRRFPSARMKYAMCYYSPENRFPAAVFGDFAASIRNRRVCSVDRFSYHAYPRVPLNDQMPREWAIRECTVKDLSHMADWYNNLSGGLMFDAMCLCQKTPPDESIERSYDKLGLIRRTKTFSLRNQDKMIAGIIVNFADPGLNLSQLFSSVTLLVMDEQGFPWPLLGGLLSSLTNQNNSHNIPVLIYPADSAKGRIPPSGKEYKMWVLSAQHGEEYLDFIEKRFKLGFSKNFLLPGVA